MSQTYNTAVAVIGISHFERAQQRKFRRPPGSSHSGSPARRRPSSNRLRSSGLRSGTQSLTAETRFAGSSLRKRDMAFCASGMRPASALAAARSRMDAK